MTISRLPFLNEDAVPQEHEGYTIITCVICGRPFLVGKGIVVRDCGDEQYHLKHPREKEYA